MPTEKDEQKRFVKYRRQLQRALLDNAKRNTRRTDALVKTKTTGQINNLFARPGQNEPIQKYGVKHAARTKAGTVKKGAAIVKTGARATEAAAKGTQTAAKGAEVMAKGGEMAAKGIGAASKATDAASKGITQAGQALSSTGLGAIIGVPLMALGGAGQVASKGTQIAAKGGEIAAKGAARGAKTVGTSAKKVGEAAKSTRRRIDLVSKQAMIRLRQKNDWKADKTQTAPQSEQTHNAAKKKAKGAMRRGTIMAVDSFGAALDLSTLGISLLINVLHYIFTLGWLNLEMIYGKWFAKGKSRYVSPISWEPIPMPIDKDALILQAFIVVADLAIVTAVITIGFTSFCFLHDYVMLITNPIQIGTSLAAGGTGGLCLGGIITTIFGL